MSAGNNLRDFLLQISEAQERQGHGSLSVHGHVLREGRKFESQPLTPGEQEYIDRCGWQAHPIKQCYQNAQMTALTMPLEEGIRLRYAEGFVSLGGKYAVNHAWLSLNGKVVDTTLRVNPDDDAERVMGGIPEGWEYWGVEMDPRECLHSLEHGSMGPILDDWQCGWPMINGGTPARKPARKKARKTASIP